MSANLKSTCEKFVPGHLPQKAGEEFALIADYCRENNFAADVYGTGDLINSFETKVAELLGFEATCFMPSGTMAREDKIWTANHFQSTALENFCYTEIYVGEGLLQIGDEQLFDSFSKLIELSK